MLVKNGLTQEILIDSLLFHHQGVNYEYKKNLKSFLDAY
jgi:hypothetical protein